MPCWAHGSSTLRLHTPISLRDQCQPPPTGMGVFIAAIDTDCDVTGDEDVWSLAHHCTRDLRRQRPAAHRKLGLLALAGDDTALAQKYERTAHGRTATVEVSNVGRMSAPPEGAAVWLTLGRTLSLGLVRVDDRYVGQRRSATLLPVVPGAAHHGRACQPVHASVSATAASHGCKLRSVSDLSTASRITTAAI